MNDEQVRHPEDKPWWNHYDTCCRQGYGKKWSAYAADIAVYGKVVNNPKPKGSKEVAHAS